MAEEQTIQIDNTHLPIVGFGTYLIPSDVAQRCVSTALNTGYRHIDTAEKYANEDGVGAAIKEVIESTQVTRDDIFLTTKVWPGYEQWGETPKSYADTINALDESLQRLQTDYVDLYLIHSPLDSEHRLEQWRALAELQQQGKTRTIGVSNFNKAHIEELADAGLPRPTVNQIELHPWSQKPALIDYLVEHNITPMAYSSLAPLSSWRTAEGQASGKTEATYNKENAELKSIAAKHGVTEAQVLLRWAIQKGFAIIPKSVNPERIVSNFALFEFTLNDEDMVIIANINRDLDLAWGENFFEF